MKTVSRSLEFTTPADAIWAVASDFSRYGEWRQSHNDFPEGPPSLDPNSSFKENLLLMGMPGQAEWTVSEIDAPRSLLLSGKGPMGVSLGMHLELAPNGAGTTVTIESKFGGGMLMGPLASQAEKALGESDEVSLQKLRDLVA